MNQIEPEPESTSVVGRRGTAMKFLIVGSFMAVFALVATPSHAADLWRMDGFTTDVVVEENGVLYVQESIDAEFLQPRHGIFRYIPYKGTTTDGKDYRLGIQLIDVKDEYGTRQAVKETREGNNIVWRIGDANRTLTGPKTYLIRYEVHDAILRLEDHDELFWNISGFGWDVSLPVLRTTVHFEPLEVSELTTRCFTGSYGSNSNECSIGATSESASFISKNEGEPMSVAVLWPKGHVGTEAFVTRLASFLAKWWHLSIPFLALAFYWAAWREYGDDDTSLSIAPEYDSPQGLRPAQLQALIKHSASAKDISPTIIDLAVRGFIRIEEVEMKHWYGKEKDYLLKRIGTETQGLVKYEKTLIANLFGGRDEKKVSELKNVFYKDIPEFTEGVMESLVHNGMFDAHPSRTRLAWILPGLILLGAGMLIVFGGGFASIIIGIALFMGFFMGIFFLVRRAAGEKDVIKSMTGPFKKMGMGILFLSLYFAVSTGGRILGNPDPWILLSLILSAMIVLGFGWFMPKWTHSGAAAVRHAKGFKMFISKVKKYRTAWEEKENIFETVLPYALAFGLGKKWSAAFADLNQQPPTWYVGTSPDSWNPVAFESSLSSMTKSFTANASSSPSSSGGSSGGGGFSGGGFGGGGGGSW